MDKLFKEHGISKTFIADKLKISKACLHNWINRGGNDEKIKKELKENAIRLLEKL